MHQKARFQYPIIFKLLELLKCSNPIPNYAGATQDATLTTHKVHMGILMYSYVHANVGWLCEKVQL